MALVTPRTAPAPLIVSPTWSWDGDDGNWTTFSINVGTPPQSFRVLPATSGAETWVPIPEGCQGILSGVSRCGTLRGVNSYDGSPSAGFQSNASSSWETIGIYQLTSEQNLFSGDANTGLYGLDTISMGTLPSGSTPDFTSQTVAGIATGDFWLGSLGLGTARANFSTQSKDIPSLMSTLKNQSVIPSLSYGYAAGAHYSPNQTPGSLVLGGYDQARFTPSNMSFPLGGADNQTLGVSIESVIAINAFGGTVAMLQGGSITAAIDSTASQLWLPQKVCDLFAQAFGLTYDSTTNLYVVNSTIHSQLVQKNPSVTFTLSANASGSSSMTTNIVMPYAAFNLYAGIPIYNTSTPYFPLRVAANASQHVLGRAFLQEAYVFVDWERNNFTLGQAIHQNRTSNIVPVLPPAAKSVNGSGSSGTDLSAGAIAGVAVGAAAVVASIIGIILFCILRRRRQQRKKAADQRFPGDGKATELHGDHVIPPEIMSHQVHELENEEQVKTEIMSTPMTELPAGGVEKELDGTPTVGTPRPGDRDYSDDLAKRGIAHEATEPTQTVRYELP